MPWEGQPWTGSAEHRRWVKRILTRDPVCRCPGCKIHPGPCANPSEQADHVVPVSEGGRWTMENGQGLCAPCHLRKSSAEGNRARWHRNPRKRQAERHPGLR